MSNFLPILVRIFCLFFVSIFLPILVSIFCQKLRNVELRSVGQSLQKLWPKLDFWEFHHAYPLEPLYGSIMLKFFVAFFQRFEELSRILKFSGHSNAYMHRHISDGPPPLPWEGQGSFDIGFISAHWQSHFSALAFSCIPDICHRHHKQCLCKFFLASVNFSRLNAKNYHFTV